MNRNPLIEPLEGPGDRRRPPEGMHPRMEYHDPEPRDRGPHGPHGPGPFPPPMPDDGTVDGHLLNLLRMAGHLAMMKPGLRSGQFRVLSLLTSGGWMPQKQLAEQLRIQPGSLSELMGKLEQAGAIEREKDDADRRAVSVRITERGQERLNHMRETLDIDRSELLCMLSDEEKQTLTALLEKIVRNNRPPRPEPPAHRGPRPELLGSETGNA